MFCKKCGHKFANDRFAFCTKCGTKAQNAEMSGGRNAITKQSKATAKPKAKGMRAVIGGIAAGVLTVSALAVALIFSGDSDDDIYRGREIEFSNRIRSSP